MLVDSFIKESPKVINCWLTAVVVHSANVRMASRRLAPYRFLSPSPQKNLPAHVSAFLSPPAWIWTCVKGHLRSCWLRMLNLQLPNVVTKSNKWLIVILWMSLSVMETVFLSKSCDPVPVGVKELLVAVEYTSSPLCHWCHRTKVSPSFFFLLPIKAFKDRMKAIFLILVTASKVL